VAVVVGFRIAIFLAPPVGAASVRVVQWSQGPGVDSAWRIGTTLRDRLLDPGESDADLEDALSAAGATLPEVATYTGTFEMRKLHMIWSQKDAALTNDDARVCTFHLLKVTGAVPQSAWDAADFTAVKSAFSTAWLAISDRYSDAVVLDRMKFYKDGPQIEPPQSPVHDADYAQPGTANAISCPPQVAVTVTEMAGTKRHWGRFYLPSPAVVPSLTNEGRFTSTFTGDIADAFDTCYEACKAAGIYPVVYRPALPVRQTAEEKRNNVTPGSLPARSASAWDVEKIQIDDVPDVMRSRRYKFPTLKTQREIA
jgi:hypothetical protein